MSPTPAELFDTWRGTAVGGEAVQLFYGHHDRADDPWFSNFYVHEPFDFAIPPWCCKPESESTLRPDTLNNNGMRIPQVRCCREP